jgi:DNA-binding NarL/FixJ family response regulator
MIYIDSASEDDPGMQMLKFARRSATSPDRAIPVVVVSQGRDMATIQAVGNAGAHEYALFPASGEQLKKKVHAAHTSNRPFVDTPDYVGPERKPPPVAPKPA